MTLVQRPSDSERLNDFADLGLEPALVRALVHEGYHKPTPIQEQAIPRVLQGNDLVACAQTGTGKTAAFVLPLMQRLGRAQRQIRGLILTPTRELALQIGQRATAYGKHLDLGHVVIYGGVSQRGQERELRRKPDLVIATPGRLLDLMRQQLLSLRQVETLVLDEADTMLDMGFVHDIRRVIAAMPSARQTLLFSATMPASIEALVREVTKDPLRVAVARESTPAEKVQQSVIFVEKSAKRQTLQQLIRDKALKRVLVFTRTKHGANRLADQLTRAGIGALAIHGNKSQSARERALGSFKQGSTAVLVATDVAARGIDVQGVSMVVNFELPNVPESYVHRIGRTGRAGAAGQAVSLCDRSERTLLTDIERLIRQRIQVADDRSEVSAHALVSSPKATPAAKRSELDSRAPRQIGRRRSRRARHGLRSAANAR